MHSWSKLHGTIRALAVGGALAAWSFSAGAALAESYTYDALGRLTSVTSDAGVVTNYCYDAAGNRTYVGPAAC